MVMGRPPSGQDKPVLEPGIQQAILQQAEAVIAAQNNTARPMGQEADLQETDLITLDAAEGDGPPPAYGDIYGEIRNEKYGLGTSAHVTDDGRVNIRINQLNRRLSQILTPALREQVRNTQDSGPPPSPYIPPSLGGEEGVPPPPPLNVVIQVVGSRGDVQPFVALGKVLKYTYGHRVRLATHPNFKDFVQEHGLEFFSIGGDPSRLMAFMVENPNLLPGFRSLLSGDVGQRRRDVAEYIQGCWRSCYQAGDGMAPCASDDHYEPVARPFVADCIIANPPSFAHIHCAEKLGIPLHIMFTMPYSPTQAFPHPLANIQSSNAGPQLTNYISYAIIEVLSWQSLGDIINRFRAKCLGLDPVSLVWGPGMLQRLKVPHTYCWSPALIPKPEDWGSHISISGFYNLNLAANYIPPPSLQAFLDAGPPPVYIGFGSIVLDNPSAMTELIFNAVKTTGQRVLLYKGWGGISVDELRSIPEGIFMLGNVPHDWLFKHVSCVVHHGGAGTTAAGIAAGRPTVVVPFFGDQAFWGAMVARAGAGPDPIPHKQLTADKLVDAINFCLMPEILERAKALASKIATERGSDMGAQSFHQHLEADRLRCTLTPSRPAAWRIKRTQIRLSAFAASTLANANLLDFRDLKLFRPQEYETDEGPWDPISGGFVAFCGAIGSMATGLVNFPTETLKALQLPFRRDSQQQSQTSMPTRARKRDTSNMRERTTLLTSSEQSQTSLDIQESVTRVQSAPNPSGLSPSTTLSLRSNSISDALQDQVSPKKYDATPSRLRSWNQSSSSKDHDILHQAGVHMGRGLGSFAKALVKSPMELSIGLSRGLQNMPKHWGDDTVRPQAKVSDFMSGAKTAGKAFGLGWYDGVTGLVTQPWNGAQKEGATGFFKGIGKGMGGFFAKPSAAVFGVPSYIMKGVHKEMQRVFGRNVQNYIVTSRAAQGYEEWLQSADVEKQDVIVQWKLVQKYLNRKRNPDEMLQDFLEVQRKAKIEDRYAHRDSRGTANYAQSTSDDASTLDTESAMLAIGRSMSPEDSLRAAESDEAIQLLAQEMSHRDTEEHSNERQEAASLQAYQGNLRQAMAISEAESLEYEEQMKLVIAQSLREQEQAGSDSESQFDTSCMSLEDEDDEELERARQESEKMANAAGWSSCVQQPPSYDSGHLAGTTQIEFEAQRQGQQAEKTTQEKTEEEIVIEYVKKQSLLEQHHQNKGKGRAAATEDKDDEDLQNALKLSMQEHEYDVGHQYGEASRM
ncbi:hypothetical protein BJX63DRAFT_427218 [Aspergillus granulosus]|uniref:Glycosyltransferase family 28 N-terminal domain-containing protein n=1 Tax=Aspergillus granulosus TaxID=176169 RepID=A0ABR4I4V7_9EURO